MIVLKRQELSDQVRLAAKELHAQAHRVVRLWTVIKSVVIYTPEEFMCWRQIEDSLCQKRGAAVKRLLNGWGGE